MYFWRGDKVVWQNRKGFSRGSVLDAYAGSRSEPRLSVGVNYSARDKRLIHPDEVVFLICPQDGTGWVSQEGGRLSERVDHFRSGEAEAIQVTRICNSCNFVQVINIED
jgi:hypothetical protein